MTLNPPVGDTLALLSCLDLLRVCVLGTLSAVVDEPVNQNATVFDEAKQVVGTDRMDRTTRWIKDVESGGRSVSS